MDKYYIPQISDIRVGYECEKLKKSESELAKNFKGLIKNPPYNNEKNPIKTNFFLEKNSPESQKIPY